MIDGSREAPGSRHDWRRERTTVWLTWAALAVIVLIQAQPFTYGYRRSADEVTFLHALSRGWPALEEMTVSLAVFQGRLGLLATTPLNALGAYLSDHELARWIFVLLHFGVYALFAAWFSIVSATGVTRSLLVFLIAFQTICARDDYMPPITYPLQNTLPFIALLAARCTILRAQRHDRGWRPVLWPARLVFLLAMLTTEFAFLLGTALLAAEYAFALARRWNAGQSIREGLVDVVRQRAFACDVALVVLALLPYLAYRALHPSSYVGNVIDAGDAIGRVVETTVRHVLAGTVLSRDVLDVRSLPADALPLAALVGLLTAACVIAVLSEVRNVPAPASIAFGAVLAIAYVTFPIAGNARQQVWCIDNGACGYLDSRISYLGFAIILICIVGLILRRMPSAGTARVAIAAIAIATGLIGATTYARNLRDGREMMVDSWTWERAALLACYPEEQPADDLKLLRLIDAERRIRFHPGADRAQYWRDYMGFVRKDGQCPPDSAARRVALQRMKELGPVVSVGQTILFEGISTTKYLGKGWSGHEPWGVWSDGERASLVFQPRSAAAAEGLQVRLVFRPYIRPSVGRQVIAVSVNGRHIETWTITKDMHDKGCCERTIDLGKGLNPDQDVDISFHIQEARKPDEDRDFVDSRRLGMYLHSMTFGDATGGPPRGR